MQITTDFSALPKLCRPHPRSTKGNMCTDSLYYCLWWLRLDSWIPISHQNFFYQHKYAQLKVLSFSGKREASQSIEFPLALKSEHIRSALLDEFSSREACSSSAFYSSKVGTYCSQEELFLSISGHGDVFITLKKCQNKTKVLIFVFLYSITFDSNALLSTLRVLINKWKLYIQIKFKLIVFLFIL